MIGKGTQRTIPLDLLGAIAGALDAAGNAPKTLATVRELIGQDEHPTHQGANTMSDDLPPPEPHLKLMWRDGQYRVSRANVDWMDCYTADQMRAYGDARAAAAVARERERCAKACDEHASIEGIAQNCAAAIRAGS